MPEITAVLIDIDGVLTVSWRPLPGAVEAVTWLREQGLAVKLLTNTTSRTRATIAATLAQAGFPVTAPDILTAPVATAAYLAAHYPGARCFLLNSGDIAPDLADVRLIAGPQGAGDGDRPDVVILGGAGPEFSYAALNQAFGYLMGGARLVAMHRNLYWRTDDGLQLDTGAFLDGLECAVGVTAEITGKPAGAFFATALAAVAAEPPAALMIGDDIESDVLAAQRAGITGVLVKTGKYLPQTHQTALGAPDHVIESIADLPALLASGAVRPA
jgi:HAD superfamily hydrolase (TIGR01458 family)